MRDWLAWGKVFGKLTFSKPTQAAFVLRSRTKAVASGG